jgi:pimeloyl-ACP methyl ester carboxylesterase
MAVAGIWPRGVVPPDYGDPVRADVPVLLLSGTHDPVTPPCFGGSAAKHLKNSLHLVVPGAHGVGGPVIERIERDFLASGTVKKLDTSGIEKIRLPPFKMPGK